MKCSPKQWLLAIFLAAAMFAASPSASRASSSSDDDAPSHDARLDGYKDSSMVLNSGGTATTYILLGLLGVLCFGVLFINGKRTHLD